MEIQDLGSIGEFVSSVVVVITLIFLTVQLRQNTRAIRSTSFQDTNQDQIRLTQDAWRFFDLLKSAAGEPLQGPDRSKAAEFFYNTFRSYETAWYQYRTGNLESIAFEGHRRWMIWGLGNPAGDTLWDGMKPLFHPEFCTFVDELRAELDWNDHPCAKIIANDAFFENLARRSTSSSWQLGAPQ